MKNTGFTMIEMMVVIGVLLLLIAAGIPTFTGLVMAIHTHNSQAIINQLNQAVLLYQMDFSTAPNSPGGDPNGLPVSNYNDGANTWYGCESIALALTGYYYRDNNGNVSYGANPSNGYGWKSGRNSQILGPYNDSERVEVTPGGDLGYTSKSTPLIPPPPATGGKVYTLINDANPGAIADCGAKTAHHVFLDAFGKAITYYSTNNATRTYAYRPSGELADNFCADGIHDHDVLGNAYTAGVYYSRQDVYWENKVHADPGQSGTQSGVYSNLTAMFAPPPSSYYKNASGSLYRNDFMLLSWGGDSKWYGAGGSLKDDANNLYGK